MRIIREWNANSSNNIVTIYGASTEVKPVSGIHDGSIFIETDTQQIFMFDEKNTQWREI